MEELREAETRMSDVLRWEEADRIKCEMEQEVEMIKRKEQENVECLEQAMASERKQWRQEREKLQEDLENAVKQLDIVERQKLEIVAGWNEHTDSWAQKMLALIELLRHKNKETERLKYTLEELQRKAELKQPKMVEELKGLSNKKPSNFFRWWIQRTDVREKEQVKKTKRLEPEEEESKKAGRIVEMGEVMEALVEEMDNMMRRLKKEE